MKAAAGAAAPAGEENSARDRRARWPRGMAVVFRFYGGGARAVSLSGFCVLVGRNASCALFAAHYVCINARNS